MEKNKPNQTKCPQQTHFGEQTGNSKALAVKGITAVNEYLFSILNISY